MTIGIEPNRTFRILEASISKAQEAHVYVFKASFPVRLINSLVMSALSDCDGVVMKSLLNNSSTRLYRFDWDESDAVP